MIRPRGSHAELVVSRAKRNRKAAYVRQRLPGRASEPKVRPQVQFLCDADPNDATARLLSERHRYGDVAGSLGESCLELNVANCMAPREHKVVAMGIELRAQHLDVHDAMLPQSAQRLSDEDVLDNVLA